MLDAVAWFEPCRVDRAISFYRRVILRAKVWNRQHFPGWSVKKQRSEWRHGSSRKCFQLLKRRLSLPVAPLIKFWKLRDQLLRRQARSSDRPANKFRLYGNGRHLFPLLVHLLVRVQLYMPKQNAVTHIGITFWQLLSFKWFFYSAKSANPVS